MLSLNVRKLMREDEVQLGRRARLHQLAADLDFCPRRCGCREIGSAPGAFVDLDRADGYTQSNSKVLRSTGQFRFFNHETKLLLVLPEPSPDDDHSALHHDESDYEREPRDPISQITNDPREAYHQ